MKADWNSLYGSNKAQDKAKYLAAQAKLAQDYADLGGLADISDRALTQLVGDLQQSLQ
jgi:hypothetical protein